MYTFIKDLVFNLEEIVYNISCVVTDNNAVNSKATSSFSKEKKLSIVYPRPVDNKRPSFYLILCISWNVLETTGWILSYIKNCLLYTSRCV